MESEIVTPKPVILVATYGTGTTEGERDNEKIDTIIRERFPGYDVRWAYTAEHFLKMLEKVGKTTMFERKLPIKRQGEVYSDLVKEGKTNVAVLCLLVHESLSVSKRIYEQPTQGLNVKYSKPLLADIFNVEPLVQSLVPLFGGEDTANILAGHGGVSEEEFFVNAPLLGMDEYVRWRYKNVFVATIHRARLDLTERAFADVRKGGFRQVIFIPLSLIASEHTDQDIMADTPESWKSQLGLPARATEPFCDNPVVMEVFMNYLGSVLAEF